MRARAAVGGRVDAVCAHTRRRVVVLIRVIVFDSGIHQKAKISGGISFAPTHCSRLNFTNNLSQPSHYAPKECLFIFSSIFESLLTSTSFFIIRHHSPLFSNHHSRPLPSRRRPRATRARCRRPPCTHTLAAAHHSIIAMSAA